MRALPRVCVVVSAYNRAELLGSLVDSLKAQTVRDFEAKLVDNGSTDGTYEELVRLTAGDDRFEVLRIDENRGPARARNMAWRAGTAPWVAFTDDDCAPRPGWLAGLLEVSETADFIQGRTVWAEYPTGARPGWFDRAQRIEGWSGRYETCNLLISRALLERHDGFNERFRIAMGEDTDLGLRASAAGARTAFAPAGVVEHRIWHFTFGDYLEQRRRYSELVELMKVNPDARRLLRWGFVLRGVHLLVLALVPMAVVGWWAGLPWLPLAAVALWSAVNAYRTRSRPFPAWKRLLYSGLHFVGYAYEVVCFAISSVRYRSLVI